MSNLFYTFFTTVIILLGRLREKFCSNRSGTAMLRLDRVIPWCNRDGSKILYMECCDCGLGHFVISGHSLTPIRTEKYSYKLRFGANAWTNPNIKLCDYVLEKAKECKVI